MSSPPPEARLKVFISYSRKDLARAELLRDQLIAAGFEAYLDKHDILPGEPWQERLSRLIEFADAVVFLISPDSVASEICDWEVNEAERLGKRILPAVIRETPPESVPGRLRRLNFVFMRDATEEPAGLASLASGIRTDIAWLREHTRLGQRAADWERSARATGFLLHGGELAAAELWISERPSEGATPSAFQREFIQASRTEALAQATRAGRVQVMIGLLVLAIAGALGYLGWASRAAIEFQARLVLDSVLPASLSTTAERALLPGERFKECASCPEMVVVPAGEFQMGSPEGVGQGTEYPQHRVTIAKPFAVSRFEVTFAQWDACVAHGGCTHKPDDRGWGRGDIPVTDVSWDDAQIYLAWLSRQTGCPYRLLTEAEWEYAARANSTTVYPWGDEVGSGNANCPDCGSRYDTIQPAPVGSFAANGFGLYDMIGNLWEWVEDTWHEDYEGAPTDGSAWIGDSDHRVTRGGAYSSDGGDHRSAFRDFARPHDFRNYIFGIRVARTLAR